MPVNRYLLFTFISLLLHYHATAQLQTYKVIPPQYELEHLKLNLKKDAGIFNDITEDKEGNLWLSSTSGIYVFDGHNTISYTNGDKVFQVNPDSATNIFGTFSPAASGSFWVTQENEYVIPFNPASRKVVDTGIIKIPDKKLYTIFSNTGSRLFFLKVNNATGEFFIYENFSKDSTRQIYASKYLAGGYAYYKIINNYHWIFHAGTVIRISLDGTKTVHYSVSDEAKGRFFVYFSNKTIYWIDNKQDAVYTWNEAAGKPEVFMHLPSFIANKIHAFYVADNIVYIGSNLNLYIISKNSGTIQDLSAQFTELVKKEAPGSLSEALNKFYLQSDGTVLLQTLSNLYRLKKKTPPAGQFRQSVLAEANTPKVMSFRALTEDEHKNIYCTYYTGISQKKFNQAVFNIIPAGKYVKGGLVSTYSINYWKGYLLWNNVKIEIATGKHTYLFDSAFGGHCTQFLQHDSLWIFKWGSKMLHCYSLQQDVLNSYPLDVDILPYNGAGGLLDMNDIIADADGQNLWVSSRDYGLTLITKKGKKIKQFSLKELLTSDNYITDLELDGELLWFGCTDGLGVMNTRTEKVTLFKNPAIINGQLKNRTVFTVQPDPIGNFYLGSSYGLLYFDTKEAAFYNLPETHPLATVEFNRAAALRSSEGRYYFGSTDGLFAFTPGELDFLKSSNALKPIKLFGISVFNSQQNTNRYLSKDLNSLKKLVLNPFDNNIEFSFSVPEFYRNVYYSYRIKGQNDNWTAYKPDNKILLLGLQAGSYTLEIKASTSLTDENAVYYSLPIEMNQTWYKKNWVIILMSLIAAGLLVAFFRLQFNQKIKRQKELASLRTKISSDLHDDVGTILSGLAMQSQMLTFSAKEEQKAPLLEISQMSRDAMERMRDTVWAMDSRKDKFENLVDRMRDFAEKNLAAKNMTHEFTVTDIDSKKFINPEKRQAVYLIFKEAVTNIVKHSNGSHVIIHFAYKKNSLHLSIHDNGTEKPVSNSDGLGMSNMKMRAKKIGGTLSATYQNGYAVLLIL